MKGASLHGSAYGVKYQARCIAPLLADTRNTRFLVGTQNLREENEVHVIQLAENSSDVICEGLYTHQQEIWDLAPCPFDAQIISSVYPSADEYVAAIWKIPGRPGPGRSGVLPLQKLSTMDCNSKNMKCTLWWPSGKHNQMLSIDAESLLVWDVNTAQGIVKLQGRGSAGELHHMAGGSWDPHDVSNVATEIESSVQMWDLRSMKQSSRIEQAHAFQVRDMDFNPKKQHLLITAGDDSKLRLWDMKMPGMPVKELPGHAHWTWRVKYNPKYEELILSSGTDSAVNLWHVFPVSSSKTILKSPRGSPKVLQDSLIRSYTEHEDSVYGIAWSSADPWVLASLSYDGRVMVDSVPLASRKDLTWKVG